MPWIRTIALGVCLAVAMPLLADEGHQHGPANPEQLGQVSFPTSCSAKVQKQFERAMAMLHSFWYEEAERSFTEVAKADPKCAMAYWGMAMTYYHPLWEPRGPNVEALRNGWAAVEKAKAAGAKTQRERDYIAALESFYKDFDKQDHRARVVAHEKAMESVTLRHPKDREAGAFYALALLGTASALPVDKTYPRQKQAGALAEKLFAEKPEHPGAAHYIIHSYDYPPLAERALPAARRYAKIAPDSPHALHMPSHIFTRMGLWQESIGSNRDSAAAARKHGLAGDELHALDYLVYAYLQSGQDQLAQDVLKALPPSKEHTTKYFQGLYARATAPARFVVETRRWREAAAMLPAADGFPAGRYAWAQASIHFARTIAAARTRDVATAREGAPKLAELRDILKQAGEDYWANQVEIQRIEAAGWTAFAEGKKDEALSLLRSAADLEDATDKHPVTPGPITPAREMLAEALLELKRPAEALPEFEKTLVSSPNRFNALYGAARAAELAGNRDKAREHYAALLKISSPTSERQELRSAKAFLGELARK